ncbi:MAG: MmcQ/YjbR family DNA-binding protein [Blastocatellia bacterium]
MKKTITFETVRQMMFALPGVEEGTSWGTPAFRVRNKLLARLHEDGETLVLKCDDRDLLIESDPLAFYVTKHYQNYPWVLVRLAKVRQATLRDLIEQAWRTGASPKLIKLYESGEYEPPPVKESPLPKPAKPKPSGVDQCERARRICLALPEVEEKEAWGAPTYRVKGKMFAMYVNNHHGDGRVALWLKAPAGVQAMLVEAEPEKFFIPPYQGPAGWIGVHLDRCTDDEVAFHARQAYCMAAPPKLQAMLASQSGT